MPCLMQQQVIDRYNDTLYKNVNIKTKKIFIYNYIQVLHLVIPSY